MRRRVVMGAILVATIAWSTAVDGQAYPPRRVWLGEPYQEGGKLIVPLVIDDISEVVAGGINLVFDHAAVGEVTARATDLLRGFAFVSNVDADTLKIAFASAQADTGTGAFAEIVIEDEEANPSFSLSLVSLNGGQIPVEYDNPTSIEEIGAAPGSSSGTRSGGAPGQSLFLTTLGLLKLASRGQVSAGAVGDGP